MKKVFGSIFLAMAFFCLFSGSYAIGACKDQTWSCYKGSYNNGNNWKGDVKVTYVIENGDCVIVNGDYSAPAKMCNAEFPACEKNACAYNCFDNGKRPHICVPITYNAQGASCW